MDAKNTADVIISFIKKSNLNYQIQESPFSLLINIRKSYIRNKNGDDLLPCSDIFVEVDTHKVKVEEENSALRYRVNHLEVELHDSNVAVHDLSTKLEKSKEEIADVLFNKNTLVKNNQKLEHKETEIKTIKSESNDFKTEIESLKSDVKSAIKSWKNNS